MKKILAFILISVLAFSLIGCQADENVSEGEGTNMNSGTGGETDADSQGNTGDTAEDPDKPVSSEDSNSSTLLDTQTVAVEYVGQIDNNSIEVKIEDGVRALRLTGMAKEQLEELKPEAGDILKLEVFKNENDQETVYSMEKSK